MALVRGLRGFSQVCRFGAPEKGSRQVDDSQLNEHVGKQLRRRRRSLGVAQQSLAEACGVTFQQIQKYECGASRLTVGRLWVIAHALEVPMSYFFEGLCGGSVQADHSERHGSANGW